MRDRAKALYLKACQETGKTAENLSGTPAEFKLAKNDSDLEAQGIEQGLPARKAKHGNDDLFGIIEMTMYGIKGTAAYLEHAMVAGLEDEKIYDGINEVLSKICDPKLSVNDALANALKVGELNLNTMALLDKAQYVFSFLGFSLLLFLFSLLFFLPSFFFSTTKFGHPEPTSVRTHPVAGKCILVSGHDLTDLELILQQTEGKGINVYTHGEYVFSFLSSLVWFLVAHLPLCLSFPLLLRMLPAHGYPGLKKYKHLAGNYGTAWQLQKMEFAAFPGPIVMTSNCIIEPQKSYKNRIFTRRCVGFSGVQHVEGNDFSAVIKSAQSCLGFSAEDAEDVKKPLTVGFGRNTVMGVADKVIEGVKSGAIKRFFVIGGCDGTEGERSYFRDIAKATPKDSLILTLGCGKYRFNSLPLGDIGGIPRVLDMGQCNDAFSAISVAAALAGVFKTDVNKLPLSFAISWFEQKAVAVFLTLLHLNLKNIRLGPRLPAFATPNMVKILVENYGVAPIGDVQTDMKNMMQGK
jgi:hydroxylamine reductase